MSTVGVVNYDFTADTRDLDKKLDGVDKNVEKTTDKSSKFVGKMADAFKVASVASAAAVVGLTTAAVNSYASYEQLTGGVETLFKSSSNTVMNYANQAYKTAGMSANKYMETVTSFSASLLQGLGGDTEKAAKYADKAVVAMSDNANKMGTSMEAIQYAYQGFAKQNYTMLDNLKLGYGGTASEMARLVNESGVMGSSFKATAKNINEVSFDKIIEAISVTQDRLGITGTTAKEAGSTIEGSFNSMKGAWENFITALAGGGDLETTFNNLVESVKIWLGNLVPVVAKTIENLAKIVGKKISEAFNNFRKELGGWATLIEVLAVSITAAVVAWGLWNGAIAAWKATTQAATAIQEAFNLVMKANPMMLLVMAIAALVAGLVYFFTQTEMGKKIWQDFCNFIGEVFKNIGNWLGEVGANIGAFFKGIGDFFIGIWNGITSLFNGIVEFFKQWGLTILAIIFWPISLLVGLFFTFKDQIIGFFQSAWNGIVAIWNGVAAFFGLVWNGIVAIFTPVAQFFGVIFQSAWNGIMAIWNGVVWYYTTIWNGIKAVFGVVAGFFIGVFTTAWNGIKNVFSGVFGFFAGIWNGIVGIFKGVGDAIGGAISGAVKWAINGVLSFAAGMINGFIDAINLAIGIINAIPGVHIGKIGKLNVPRFETGGIVGPQGGGSLIWAGDGGENEWIVPESKMASLIDKINSQTGGTGGNNYTINVSGTFATSPAEQRKVAELIREQLELNDKRRFA
nr:MAG TPA: tail tape measure protein [Caudoviricetes sp.]